jgi:hypothetical protein
MKRHSWTESDDLVALYLYRFGLKRGAPSVEEFAEALGISVASMKMRIANFRAIKTGSGLGHCANQSIAVYNNYRNTGETELRALALRVLTRK